MRRALPEPTDEADDVKLRFLDYLDFYRSAIVAKLDGLDDAQLRRTVLPSGWTPVELLTHLVHMERRWLRWGFLAEDVAAPWGDSGGDRDGRWQVAEAMSLDDLVASLHDGGARTRAIVERSQLTDVVAVGGRFGPDDRRPTLAWILFHVLQEYARHAGHLDVVRELIDGHVGE